MDTVESTVNYKVQSYISQMKFDIQRHIMGLHFVHEPEKINQLVEYILGYDRIELNSNDFLCSPAKKPRTTPSGRVSKKKKETVPNNDLAEFFSADAEEVAPVVVPSSIELVAQDISGITFFIDSFGNVYNTEQVMNKLPNPQIVAHYTCDKEGKYSIDSYTC
jgi:hypothetical protein